MHDKGPALLLAGAGTGKTRTLIYRVAHLIESGVSPESILLLTIGGAEWYKGTANAIYQNIAFIEKYDPKYVVVLSGDHIYKMNYANMIDFHKKNNADCTIAVLLAAMVQPIHI